MNKRYMIDLETSGVDRTKDVILEVAMVEVDYDGLRWNAGRKFRQAYPEPVKALSVFQREHQQGLFAECNALHDEWVGRGDVNLYSPVWKREQLREFFALCDETLRVDDALQMTSDPFTCIEDPLVYLMGYNISNFDVPFLVENKFLRPSSYSDVDGKQVQHGDFSYRHYEIGGAVAFARDVLNVDIETTEKRNTFLDWAKSFDQDTVLPPGAKHGALYDCFSQLKLLNGLLHVARNGITQ